MPNLGQTGTALLKKQDLYISWPHLHHFGVKEFLKNCTKPGSLDGLMRFEMRIRILILKVWGFLRLRVAFSENFENVWGESGLKVSRKFLPHPQIFWNFEVRMRVMILRLRVKFWEFQNHFDLRFLIIDPRKPSKFEVRMRAMILRLRVKFWELQNHFDLRFFENFREILELPRNFFS